MPDNLSERETRMRRTGMHPESLQKQRSMPTFRYARHARGLALLVLAVVTAVGIWGLVTGDWTDVATYWRRHWSLIPILILLSILDVALEGIAWMWVNARCRIRVIDRRGALVFLAGRAGLLMPAQLGRLIRPDALARMGRASLIESLKGETLLFVLDGISVLALLAALLVYRLQPLAALPAGIAVAAALLFAGNRLTVLVAHTRFGIDRGFFWTGSTVVIVVLSMLGWVAHGLALYVVVAGLPGSMTVWDALVFGPGSAVLGTSTGLPGGIGATDGLLGVSLRLRDVPVEHLAVAVAAFRVVTFWVWIPIGWLALLAIRRRRGALDSNEALRPS